MVGIEILPKAFSVGYRSLDRWNVAFFRKVNWKWPERIVKPIGKILKRYQFIVDCSPEKTPIIEKITFGGELSLLPIEKRIGYKGRLFKAGPGQLIYSKIRVKQGSLCIIPNNINWLAVSAEYPVYSLDNSQIEPVYLDLVLRSSSFKHYLEGLSHGGSSKTRIAPDEFETLKIPIPPLSIQQKIAGYWQRASQNILNWELEIQEWKGNIAKRILHDYSIRIELGKVLSRVFLCHFRSNERWSASFNRYSWDLKSLIQTDRYPKEPLSKYAWINPDSSFQLKADDKVTFIPMGSVDDKDGYISKPEIRAFRQVKSGYTRFKNGDILWAKITPCMQNGKSAIASNLSNNAGFGSTEFHIVRAKSPTILKSEYIHLLLRMPEIRQAATRYFVGSAGQQRVPKEFLEKLHIPIMPIDDQNKLISLVQIERKKIENQRRKLVSLRKQSKKKVEEMILGLRPVEGI